jgi:hypothetical protein
MTVKKPELINADNAAPTIPNFGKPYHPRINPAEKKTCSPDEKIIIRAGNRISPEPLITAPKLPDIQIRKPPDKKTKQ